MRFMIIASIIAGLIILVVESKLFEVKSIDLGSCSFVDGDRCSIGEEGLISCNGIKQRELVNCLLTIYKIRNGVK